MQLHTARLCLDCQEIHDGKTCPICSSESFAYISRWIPAPERRVQPRAAPEPDPQAEAYRQLLASDRADRAQPGAARWLKRGAFGLAAVSAAAWAFRLRSGGEHADTNHPPKPSADEAEKTS